jgi:hypothetical protein
LFFSSCFAGTAHSAAKGKVNIPLFRKLTATAAGRKMAKQPGYGF